MHRSAKRPFSPASSTISVPRPAIGVDTVTAPSLPASRTIRASSWVVTAFSSWWGIPRRDNSPLSSSDCATVRVAASTGCPIRCRAATSSATAAVLSSRVRNTFGGRSTRIGALTGGTTATSNPYLRRNSPAAGAAVPVMPQTRPYIPTNPATEIQASVSESGRTVTPSLASTAAWSPCW